MIVCSDKRHQKILNNVKFSNYIEGLLFGMLFGMFLHFILVSQVHASEITYSNPTWEDIKATANNNATCIDSDVIGFNANADQQKKDDSAQDYCLNRNSIGFISYIENTTGNPDTCKFNNSSKWIFDTSNVSFFDSIVCNDGQGCTNENSSNYDNTATIDNGTCLACNTNDFLGCSEIGCDTLSNTQWLNGQCVSNELGCTDSNATNYNPNANTGDPNNYCTYCSINTPQYCENENDCNLVNGTWDNVNSYCEGSNQTPQTVEGEITIKPPNDPSYTVSQAIAPNHTSLINQSCISYNSSNICDSWRWDIDNDFFQFLLDMSFKIGITFLFITLVVVFIFKFFNIFKNYFLGRFLK